MNGLLSHKIQSNRWQSFEFRVICLRDWKLIKTKELSVLYYLTSREKRKLHTFLKNICVKMNVSNSNVIRNRFAGFSFRATNNVIIYIASICVPCRSVVPVFIFLQCLGVHSDVTEKNNFLSKHSGDDTHYFKSYLICWLLPACSQALAKGNYSFTK